MTNEFMTAIAALGEQPWAVLWIGFSSGAVVGMLGMTAYFMKHVNQLRVTLHVMEGALANREQRVRRSVDKVMEDTLPVSNDSQL